MAGDIQALVASCILKLPADIWAPPIADERIAHVVSMMETNPSDHKSMMIGRSCAPWSKNAFVRLFRQCLGESPQAFQRQQRLAQAALLLESSSRTIEDIADACGFRDRHHLIVGL